MIDGFGREINYMRISITDRCNLRCMYCMPPEGIASVGHDSVLRSEEILHLTEIFASMGIRKIKITGGEPLVRLGACELIRSIKAIPGIEQVTLTTNGILLEEYIDDLERSGLDGINISLDTLHPETFRQITGKDELKRSLAGLHAAVQHRTIPVKVNCVPMGMENQNIYELAELARTMPVHVRYIEMMPIGLGRQFHTIAEEELLEEMNARYGAPTPVTKEVGNGPAHYYRFDGFMGYIGFISAVSHKFCDTCNRIRLTSQGYLKTCLQYDLGVQLRDPLRRGCSDEEIRRLIGSAIRQKPRSHRFETLDAVDAEQKMMSQIGG